MKLPRRKFLHLAAGAAAMLKNPTTGITGCCARAACAHAAALPTSVMNARRFTQSPCRQVAEAATASRRPRALAVFKLTTNSNVIGNWTGRSAGLAPFKI
jgi:hypothetical protein